MIVTLPSRNWAFCLASPPVGESAIRLDRPAGGLRHLQQGLEQVQLFDRPQRAAAQALRMVARVLEFDRRLVGVDPSDARQRLVVVSCFPDPAVRRLIDQGRAVQRRMAQGKLHTVGKARRGEVDSRVQIARPDLQTLGTPGDGAAQRIPAAGNPCFRTGLRRAGRLARQGLDLGDTRAAGDRPFLAHIDSDRQAVEEFSAQISESRAKSIFAALAKNLVARPPPA